MKELFYLGDRRGIITGPFTREQLLQRREALTGCRCSRDRREWVKVEQLFPAAGPDLPGEKSAAENAVLLPYHAANAAEAAARGKAYHFTAQILQLWHPAAAARRLTPWSDGENLLYAWSLAVLLGIAFLFELRTFSPLLSLSQLQFLQLSALTVALTFVILGSALTTLFWLHRALPAALTVIRLYLLFFWCASLAVAVLPGILRSTDSVQLLWGIPQLVIWGWFLFAAGQLLFARPARNAKKTAS